MIIEREWGATWLSFLALGMLFQAMGTGEREHHSELDKPVCARDEREVRALLARRPRVGSIRDPAGGETPLHSAVRDPKCPGIVQALLEHGADVRARDFWGQTPLHRGDAAYVPRLVKAGADPDSADWFGRTPLHYGDATKAQALLDCGANVDAGDRDGATALHLAAEGGQLELVRLLLVRGADLNTRDRYGMTPLRRAASVARAELPAELVARGARLDPGVRWDREVLLSCPQAPPERPLRDAIADYSVPMVQTLLSAGADLRAIGLNGAGFLHVHAADHSLIQFGLQHGLDPRTRDRAGRTPIHAQLGTGTAEIFQGFQALVQAGADLATADAWGNTRLHYSAWPGPLTEYALRECPELLSRRNAAGASPLLAAILRREKDAEELLRKRGATLTAREEGLWDLYRMMEAGDLAACRRLLQLRPDLARFAPGCPHGGGKYPSPLHLAATLGNADLAELLLVHGADLATRGWFGEAPIHDAAQGAHVAVLEVLLRHGDLAGRATDNRVTYHPVFRAESPLHWLAQFYEGDQERGRQTVALLTKYGAPVDMRNDDGETPLHCACRRDKYSVAAALIEAGADPLAPDQCGLPAIEAKWCDWRDQPHSLLHGWAAHGPLFPKRLLSLPGIRERRDGAGNTLVHAAADAGYTEMAEHLLNNGFDVRARNLLGDTPLHLAAGTLTYEHGPLPAMIRLLLAKGAEVDVRNDADQTPLYYAVRSPGDGQKEGIKLLLEHGADPTLKDIAWDRSPLDLVADDPELKALLESYLKKKP